MYLALRRWEQGEEIEERREVDIGEITDEERGETRE